MTDIIMEGVPRGMKDPRPLSEFQKHFDQGSAAGQDMSWIQRPGQALAGQVDRSRTARQALGGYAPVGNMMGFNTAWDYPDEQARNSVKNTYGRIASRYDQSQPGFLQQILGDADFQRFFPNARLGSEEGRGGMLDFGGVLSEFESGTPVGLVDVAQGYENGRAGGHQWLDQANQGGGGGFVQPQPGMVANDIYQQIQNSLMQPQGQGADNNQILQFLQMLLSQQGNM
jgi:hypothetical protein